MKRKVKKIKNRFPDHSDAIVAIHSPDGFDGNQIITASKDGSVFCKLNTVIIDFYILGWNILERNITYRFTIERSFTFNQL